jgi:hypothetical protein
MLVIGVDTLPTLVMVIVQPVPPEGLTEVAMELPTERLNPASRIVTAVTAPPETAVTITVALLLP